MSAKTKIKSLLTRAIMKCLCTGDQIPKIRMIGSNGSGGTRHTSTSNGERIENENIQEAESSLREAVGLNYEEARALLGRLEYQKGNMEGAISIFEGIDFPSIIPKIKSTLSRRVDPKKSHQLDEPTLTLPAVSLLLEAIYLKSRALHDLSQYKEAANECVKLLDTVESALPDKNTFPNTVTGNGTDTKIHEIISKSVEFLPELYLLTGLYQDAISSYRRALLTCWNLEISTLSRIQKNFAILLLYGGCEANSPNLRYQMESLFVPGNNLEEAILLLLILVRSINLRRIEWDPSVLHHLTFAMSVSGHLKSLTREFEEVFPSFLERKEALYSLALCYFGERNDETALGLLRQIVSFKDELGFDQPDVLRALLLASKICGEKTDYAKEGANYAKRAIFSMRGFRCNNIESVVHSLLGVSLSTESRSTSSDSERTKLQKDALDALQNAERKMSEKDCNIIYNLALEFAEQRKLDEALKYAKQLVKFEFGSNLKTWILLARILSGKKRYIDAENAINAALDQTGKWDQADLLRTKAKIQIARGLFKKAVESYTQLLALIQLRNKSFSAGMKILKGVRNERTVEIETWYDLAHVYLKMNQLRDVELCITKIKSFNPYSSLYWHLTGELNEAKGYQKEALNAYTKVLDLDPTHVPSLLSTAVVLQKIGNRTILAVRSYLTDALRLDRTNHIAWFQLGLLYQSEGATSAVDAAECFQAASVLEETAPVEPFR
ncbi:hypothetical protein LUZ60_014947 [Juncus effusus]|nr:hypothetical protein LUZ60_014947 [Juncus effusus]